MDEGEMERATYRVDANHTMHIRIRTLTRREELVYTDHPCPSPLWLVPFHAISSERKQ
jgi:hypothetical protein